MHSMTNSLVSRLLALLLIATFTFILMKALPGDPFNEEQALPKEIHEALRAHYGLDKPWYQQYGRYLKAIVTGDFGPSFRYKERTVNQIIAQGFSVSLLLGSAALALALSLGLSGGILTALKSKSRFDSTILIAISLLLSTPSFLLATLLQYLLAIKLGWLPIARWGSWAQLVLPTVSLAALPCAFIMRMTRSNLVEVLQADYIKTARAKGLSESQIIFKHGLRNALLPVITYLGPLTANIVVGSFIIEKIYAIPGLGFAFVTSILDRDYTVIMGATLFYSLLLLTLLFLVDVSYTLLDPRIKNRSTF